MARRELQARARLGREQGHRTQAGVRATAEGQGPHREVCSHSGPWQDRGLASAPLVLCLTTWQVEWA